MMAVSVVGTGYVGLVSGVCLAEKGHAVVCVDVDQEKINKINRGIPPIYEPGLEGLLKNNIGSNLKATTDLRQAVLDSEITLIAVGTPFDGEIIDLVYIRTVSREIGEALRQKSGYHLVTVKSTVVPGTTEEVVLPIIERASGKRAGVDFGVAVNPEFLTEGVAVHDFMHPDRIVLGAFDSGSLDVLERLYTGFDGVPKLRCNSKTAEMIKYASNSVLATLISFSNEIANLCTALGGIDATEVMEGVRLAHYFSTTAADGRRSVAPISAFLEAGCGFGGSCLPKDVKALVAHGETRGQSMPLLDTVIKVNQRQPGRIIDKLKKHFTSLGGVKVAILGLAFKPGTDDMRESPAVPIIKELLAQGAEVRSYDPVATNEAEKVFASNGFQNRRAVLCASSAQAIEGSDAVVLVTRWQEFERIPELLANIKPQPLFVDGRRMLARNSIARYDGIGL